MFDSADNSDMWARTLAVLILAVSPVLGPSSAASAAALGNVSFAASKPHPGDTGARYSWSVTTATTGVISAITFTVPAGTGGAPVVADYLGIGAGNVSLSGTTLTYAVTSPTSVSAGTSILVAIDGLTNTPTPGTYASDVSTGLDGPTTSSNSVTFAPNSTSLKVVVNRTLAFGSTASNLTMDLDPTGQADRSTAANSLSIATNATLGYTLSARATPLTGPSGQVLAKVTPNPSTSVAPGAFPANAWGFALGAPLNGGSGTLARSGGLASGGFAGFPAADSTIATNSGPTNGDTVPMTVRAKVDALAPATTYDSVITYTASPSY